jgi:hypothetical protein
VADIARGSNAGDFSPGYDATIVAKVVQLDGEAGFMAAAAEGHVCMTETPF